MATAETEEFEELEDSAPTEVAVRGYELERVPNDAGAVMDDSARPALWLFRSLFALLTLGFLGGWVLRAVEGEGWVRG